MMDLEPVARQGHCACGDVEYRVQGEPVRLAVCHCKACQLRTGSAFGVGCYFKEKQVELLKGEMTEYERESDAGRWLRFRFCSRCGTTVLWTIEAMPGMLGVAAGTFVDSSWINPQIHSWVDAAQAWVHIPGGVEINPGSGLDK